MKVQQIAVEYEGGQTIYLMSEHSFPPLGEVLRNMKRWGIAFFVGTLIEDWSGEMGGICVDVLPRPEAEFTLHLDPARQWVGFSETPGVVEWWLPTEEFRKVYDATTAIRQERDARGFGLLLLQLGYEALGTVTE